LKTLRVAEIERVVLPHDLIPVTQPEFCRPGEGDKRGSQTPCVRPDEPSSTSPTQAVNSASSPSARACSCLRSTSPILGCSLTSPPATQLRRHAGLRPCRQDPGSRESGLLLALWRRL